MASSLSAALCGSAMGLLVAIREPPKSSIANLRVGADRVNGPGQEDSLFEMGGARAIRLSLLPICYRFKPEKARKNPKKPQSAEHRQPV
jgi:hypothetical protein